MSVEYRFLEPLDVLILRGNKLFGDPGSYGESLVPPWPSAAAGAIRSRMLADTNAALNDPATWPEELGTPDAPGSFTVTAFHIARRHGDGRVEPLFQLPADLVVSEGEDDTPRLRALEPVTFPEGPGIASSAPVPQLPVLAEPERSKPASAYWLTEAGWRDYLAGQVPEARHLARSGQLWHLDLRVGVGLDAGKRSAAEGRLFSLQAVAMTQQGNLIGTDQITRKAILADYDVGFLVAVAGATPPASGTVRLGGDGRAAAIHGCEPGLPEPDYQAIAKAGCCRLVLTSPGLFAQGWLPEGAVDDDGQVRFDLHGVKGRVVCAAVPRAEIVSGWDLARWEPKPAQQAAPTGSVYWLDEIEATPEALRKLAAEGLWNEPCEDAARRAEGFNRIQIAAD